MMEFRFYIIMSSKDYQILSKLGSGAFGVVHKARNKKDNSICVIKQINIAKLDGKMRNIALNEAKIMKGIDSQYCVKFFTSFIDKSCINIVMEYCSGGDLATLIKGQMGKPIKEEIIWKFSVQMMVGLRDLHAKKILHRDIKSLNVFLDAENNVKIGDLGVAKTMNADFAHTIVGTPYYLSPQMCQEKPYNQKTDIWAMGCLIYELCTGKHPFEAQNQAALALKIVMGKFKEIPSYYSKDLDWVIRSCLSVDHKRRPTASFLLSKQQIIQWAHKVNVHMDAPVASKQQPKEAIIEKMIQKKQVKKITTQNGFYHPSHQQKHAGNNLNRTNQEIRKLARLSKSKQMVRQQPKSRQKLAKVLQKKPLSKQKRHPPIPYPEKKDPSQRIIPQKKIAENDIKNMRKFDPVALPRPHAKESQKRINYSEQVSGRKIASSPVNNQFTKDNQAIVKQQPTDSPNKKRGSVGNIANMIPQKVSRYEPEDVRNRAEFNKEDIDKMKHFDELPEDSSSDSQVQQPNKRQQKPAKLAGSREQQGGDEQLSQEVGISTEKKKRMNSFQLKKAKTINWQLELDQNHQNEKQMKQLPTIRADSQLGQVSELCMNQMQDDQVQEEIDDNRPYHSDEECQKEQRCQVQEQLLIQETGQEQITLIEKKIIENEKRKMELERLKKHHQSQLLCKITRQQYQVLKEKVVNGTEQQVQKILKTWMKNSIGLMKFYKIFHYDLEIDRCTSNIKGLQSKIQGVKAKNE